MYPIPILSGQADSEYSYDMCGRMTADKNRGITIAYNEIGQPSEITGASGVIRLSYLADGTVLSRRYGMDKWVTVEMGFSSYTYLDFEQSLRRDYVGALSLEDGGIEKLRQGDKN